MLDTSLDAAETPVESAQGRAQIQMNYSLAMLTQVAGDPEFGPQVRVYSPLPTVAFSRRETYLPGFEEAAQAARSLGYEPVIRTSGGRAVAYDSQSLVFDLVVPEPTLRFTSEFIFRELGHTLVAMLRTMAVDARLGPVDREYCPGQYSVNARGKVKLIGTSQRAARGARLISGVLLLGNTAEVQTVLTAVNQALVFDWDPATVGALFDEVGPLEHERVKSFIAAELRQFGEQLFRQDYA